MNEVAEYLAMYARYPFTLARFLRHPLTVEGARAIVRERMERMLGDRILDGSVRRRMMRLRRQLLSH